MLAGLGLEVGEVDVAAVVAGDDDDPVARPSPRDAGLVPCADDGIRQTSRWPSPRLSW